MTYKLADKIISHIYLQANSLGFALICLTDSFPFSNAVFK